MPSTQRADVGPPVYQPVPEGAPEDVGSGVSAWPGTLRVTVADRYYRNVGEALYRVDLIAPDNGTVTAEVDVPLVVPVELPVYLNVYPIRAPAYPPTHKVSETLIVTAWTSQGEPFAYGGTFWIDVPKETAVTIPDWTGAVSILHPTRTMTWLDALANPVGTFQANFNPRPRRAVRVQNANDYAIPIICHWTH